MPGDFLVFILKNDDHETIFQIIFSSNEEIPVLLTRSEEEAQKMALLKATKIIEEQVNEISMQKIICELVMSDLFVIHLIL